MVETMGTSGHRQPSIWRRMRKKTIHQLVRRLLRTAEKFQTNPMKYEAKFLRILDNIKTVSERYPVEKSYMNVGERGNREIVRALAILVPSGRFWVHDAASAQRAVCLIKHIVSDLDVTLDFECLVPESIKAMYPVVVKAPATSTAEPRARALTQVVSKVTSSGDDSAAGPDSRSATMSTAVGQLQKSKWLKVKAVVQASAAVTHMKGLCGVSREVLQQKFDVLGWSAPLLYAVLQLGDNDRPIPEPDGAVEIVTTLLDAKVDPCQYFDAILLRAIRCDWARCVDAIKEKCTEEVLESARKDREQWERKRRLHRYFSKSSMRGRALPDKKEIDLACVVETPKHDDYVNYAEFDHAGKYFLTACNDGNVRVFDAATGAMRWESEFRGGSLMHATWSPDDRTIATASTNGTFVVYNSATGAPMFDPVLLTNPATNEDAKLYRVCFSPDGTHLATCSHDGILRFHHSGTGAVQHASADLEDGVFVGAYVSSQRFAAAWQQQGVVRVFDTGTGQLIAECDISTSAMPAMVSGSEDGATFLVACGDGVVRVYRTETAEEVLVLDHHDQDTVSSAVYAADSKRILSACGGGVLRFLDAATGEVQASAHLPFDPVWVKNAAFNSAGDKIIVACCDCTARVFRYAIDDRANGAAATDTAVDAVTVSTDITSEQTGAQSQCSFTPQVLERNSNVDEGSQAPSGDDSSSDSDSSDSDDEEDITADATQPPTHVAEMSAHMYTKLVSAIQNYVDGESDLSDANELMVDLCKAIPQRLLERPPQGEKSPLVVAVEMQKQGATAVLAYSGARLTAKTPAGDTLLHVLVSQGADVINMALADLLCEHGLSVRDLDAAGVSVVDHLAQQDALETLLSAHIDSAGAFVSQLRSVVDAPDDDSSDTSDDSDIDEADEAPLGVDDGVVYRKIVDAIRAYDPSEPNTSDTNALLTDLATATASKTLNAPPPEHEPLIVVAAMANKLGAVATLLYCGANIRALSRDGQTLLHIVLAKGAEMSVELAEMLCEQGLSVLDQNAAGVSVVDFLKQTEGLWQTVVEIGDPHDTGTLWGVEIRASNSDRPMSAGDLDRIRFSMMVDEDEASDGSDSDRIRDVPSTSPVADVMTLLAETET
eukprot:m.967734 g.967734  ORF g.967734 m.967734 type:complete len:1115 (+) comp23913_c0_seq37:147-3491(+)